MDAEVLGALTPDDLVQLFTKMAEADAAGWSAKVALVQEMLRREEWKTDGSVNPGEWVAWRLDIGATDARRLVRVARDLATLPALSRALADGVVCWAKVAALSRFVTAENDEAWAEEAVALSVETIEAIARRRWAADHRRKADDEWSGRNHLYLHENRHSSIGEINFSGRMVGDDAARFKHAIETVAKNECRARGDEPMDAWDIRRGDALAMMISSHLGTMSRDRATINVHIAADKRDGGSKFR